MAKIYGALEVAQLEWFTDAGKPAASSYIYRVIYVSDLKQVQVSDGTNWIPFLNTSTNQTISGNITFSGQQIFTGLHRLSVTTDSSSTGAITALNNVTPVTEFTAAVTSISGIVNSASGATVMLVNRTGSAIAILDEDAGATAANRIRTGTGAQISLANNASIILTYVGDNRWHIVGGSGSSTGGSAGINYITNGSAEADTVGWATYADAAGSSPVDGTGGSPSVTFTRSNTSPLIGTASFIFTKGASNLQGQGASYDFTIDSAYKAKVLQISFNYLVDSGTFVAGSSTADSDVTVWLYDKTNGVVIQPSSYKLLSNNSSIADTFNATFQTASNSTSYRLIFHVGTTSASAYTLKIDGVSVSPSTYVYGTPITSWTAYTPSNTQGLGTVSGVAMYWRRVGENLEISGNLTTGTVTASEAQIGFPSGLTSTSNISTIQMAGTVLVGAAVSNYRNLLIEPSKTYFTVGVASASSQLTKQAGTTFANTTVLSFQASAPIQGWSSSVQTSDQTDTRVVAASAQIGTAAATLNGNPFNFDTVSFDSHGVITTGATTWKYTVPVSGYYKVSANLYFGATAGVIALYKNGSIVRAGGVGYGNVATGLFTSVTNIVQCNVGDTLQIVNVSGGTVTPAASTFSGSTVSNTNFVAVERLSGPSAIAASETVAASGQNTAGLSIPNNSLTGLTTPTILDNSHGSLSTSGVFTAPSSGRYLVTSSITFNANSTGIRAITIYRDGLDTGMASSSAQFTANQSSYSVSGQFRLNAGQTLQIFVFQNSGGALSLGTSGNYFSVVRVGN